MQWESLFCPNTACGEDTWMVQQDWEHGETWNISRTMDDCPFTVVASYPICPSCGTRLQLAARDIAATAERSSGAAVRLGLLIAG
jgi:hypothetical protein